VHDGIAGAGRSTQTFFGLSYRMMTSSAGLRDVVGKQRARLEAALMALGADWVILADLRVDAPPDRIAADYLLLHADYGVALLNFGAQRIAGTVDVAVAERFRRFLRERGFDIFFPGYLPIVRLAIGAQDAAFASRLVAEAFACVPRLTITDRAWAEAVGTVLTSTSPDDPAAELAEADEPPVSRDAAAPDAAERAEAARRDASPLSRDPAPRDADSPTAPDEPVAETMADAARRDESSPSFDPPVLESSEPAPTEFGTPALAEAASQVEPPMPLDPPIREIAERAEPVTETVETVRQGEPSQSLDTPAPDPAEPIATASLEAATDAQPSEPSMPLDPSAPVRDPVELPAIAPAAVAAEAVVGDAQGDEPPMSFGRGLNEVDRAASGGVGRPRRPAPLRVLFQRLRRELVGRESTSETVADARREPSVSLEPSTDSVGPQSTGFGEPATAMAAAESRDESPMSLDPPVREFAEPTRFAEPVTETMEAVQPSESPMPLDLSTPVRDPFELTVIAPDEAAAEPVTAGAPCDEPPMSFGGGLGQADEASSRRIARPRRAAALRVLFHRLRRGLVGHEAAAETVGDARRGELPMLLDPSVSVRDSFEFELTPTETAETVAARRREPPMPLDPSASVRDLFELTPTETVEPATETPEDVRWVEPILLHPLVRHADDPISARFGEPTAHRMEGTRRREPLMLFDLPAPDHAGNVAPKVTWLLSEAVSRSELSASFYSEAHGLPSLGELTVDDAWIPGASVEVRLDMALQADRALRLARPPSPRRWRPGARLLACIVLAVGVASLWFAPTNRPTGLLTVPPRVGPSTAGPVKQPPESSTTGLASERPPAAMARSDRRAVTSRHIRSGASSGAHALYAGRSRSLDGWPLPPSKD
jgi:hypothetical protein